MDMLQFCSVTSFEVCNTLKYSVLVLFVQQLKQSFIYTSKYMMGSWQAKPFDADSRLLLDSCGDYTSMCLYYTSPLLVNPYVQQHAPCNLQA